MLAAAATGAVIERSGFSRHALRALLLGLCVIALALVVVVRSGRDPSSSASLLASLTEAHAAAGEGTLGRDFFLSRLEEPLHELEGELSQTDGAAGARLRRAISVVESAIDGHLAIDGGRTATVDAVEALKSQVCSAITRLGRPQPGACR